MEEDPAASILRIEGTHRPCSSAFSQPLAPGVTLSNGNSIFYFGPTSFNESSFCNILGVIEWVTPCFPWLRSSLVSMWRHKPRFCGVTPGYPWLPAVHVDNRA